MARFWKDFSTSAISSDACPSCGVPTRLQLRFTPTTWHLMVPIIGYPLWYGDRINIAVCSRCGLWVELGEEQLAALRKGMFTWRTSFLFTEVVGQLLGTNLRISPRSGLAFVRRTASVEHMQVLHDEFEAGFRQ